MWFLFLLACNRPELDESELCKGCDDCSYDEERVRSASHVTGGVDYKDTPPLGGDHDPCWAPWGVHESEVADDNFVHNLEHGGVVFLYRCDDCDDEVAELAELVDELPVGTAILTPYSAMKTRFGAVAWEKRFLRDCFDLEAFRTFYDGAVDQAPESVTSDPSESCMTR